MNFVWMLIVACGINSGDCHHHQMVLYFRERQACIKYSHGAAKCRYVNRYVPLRDLTDEPGDPSSAPGDISGQSAGG